MVGATALGFHIPMEWRKTDDLDLVLAVEIEEFPAGLETANGWRASKRGEHRWYHNDFPVDIVPAGANLLDQGSITWPQSGFVMNLTGIDLALTHNIWVDASPSSRIAIATLPTLALLKMVSFGDRPRQRERDLQDIGQIFKHYLHNDPDRPYDDERFMDSGIDMIGAEAYFCGFDLGQILTTPAHGKAIQAFLRSVKFDEAHFRRWLRIGPVSREEDLSEILAAFRSGIQAAQDNPK